MTDQTIFAVCTHCAHVEPRPLRAENDWLDCEACNTRMPELWCLLDSAEERSQEIIEEIGMAEKERLC